MTRRGPAPAPESMLTPEEACRWLRISRRQLYRLRLPAVRLGKRTVRYHVKAVLDYLDRRAA